MPKKTLEERFWEKVDKNGAAEKYGVDVQTIRRVVRGRSYVVAATT